MPNGSIKSSDVAWLSIEKMKALSPDQIEEEYLPVVPDFVVELGSKTDKLTVVKRKMKNEKNLDCQRRAISLVD